MFSVLAGSAGRRSQLGQPGAGLCSWVSSLPPARSGALRQSVSGGRPELVPSRCNQGELRSVTRALCSAAAASPVSDVVVARRFSCATAPSRSMTLLEVLRLALAVRRLRRALLCRRRVSRDRRQARALSLQPGSGQPGQPRRRCLSSPAILTLSCRTTA